VDGSGSLLIADAGRVRAVAATTGTFYGQSMTKGDIYTIAGGGSSTGDGVPATSAAIGADGVALDAAGNLVIADRTSGLVRVVAVKTSTFYGRAMTKGDMYTVAGGGFNGLGDGWPATFAEVGPAGVAVDAAGNLVIADTKNSRVRVVAVKTGTFYGQAMKAGDIYTVAGNGGVGFSGDGGPATAAEFFDPSGVAADAVGNLVISDSGNGRVRVVAIKTGTFYHRAMTAGDIYTVAGGGTSGLGDGGPATSAELNGPESVAVTAAGGLLIADSGNNRILEVAG
jgi:trimeric autotransporter adhesin